MAYDNDKPLLTMNQVKEWRDRKLHLERKIATLQSEITELNRKLDAASIFVDEGSVPEYARALLPRPLPETAKSDDGLPPMTNTVEGILRESPRPMTRTEIKKGLAKLGYSKKRLGNYFYTCMHRLVEQDRITRNDSFYAAAGKAQIEFENTEAPSDAS